MSVVMRCGWLVVPLLSVAAASARGQELRYTLTGDVLSAVQPDGQVVWKTRFADGGSALESSARGAVHVASGYRVDGLGRVSSRCIGAAGPGGALLRAPAEPAWDPPYFFTPVPDPDWAYTHEPPLFDSAGNAWEFFTHWSDAQSPFISHLLLRRSNGHDGSWGEPETIHTQRFVSPAVTFDAQDRVTIAFRTMSSGQNVLKTLRYVPGTGWSAAVPIFQTSNYFQAVELAADAGGNVLALVDENMGTMPTVRGFRFDLEAGTWSDLGRLSPTNYEVLMPTLIANRSGDAVYLLYLVRNGGPSGLYYHRWNPATMTWSAAQRIPGAEIAGFQVAGALTRIASVIDDAGELTVLWENAIPGPYLQYVSRMVGGIWQPPVQLMSESAEYAATVDEFAGLSVNATGDVFVAFTRFVDLTTRLYTARFDHAAGQWLPTESPYNLNCGYQTRSRISFYQHRRAVCTALGMQGGVIQLTSLLFDGSLWLPAPLDIGGEEWCFLQDMAADRGEVLLIFSPDTGPYGVNLGIRSTFLRDVHHGDMNCDGVVNFGDINPFVQVLSSPAAWQATYEDCNILNADTNGDGEINFADINPFVALLMGS